MVKSAAAFRGAGRFRFTAVGALAMVLLGGLALWLRARPVLSGGGDRGVALLSGGLLSGSKTGSQDIFADVTARSGIDFTHDNGATGRLLLPEIMGAGGALFDYDNDGDLDLFVVQGSTLEPATREGAAPTVRPSPPGSRLYRNDLQVHADGSRTLHFTDVTDQSGIVARGYGMGAATGDIDNDGCVDLYVTNLGPNQMFRNNCDGTFTDVSKQTGTGHSGWGTSATFFDYDQDGWLDLFVANYVAFAVDMKRECFSRGSAPDYCSPAVYPPAAAQLFHNNGDGTFADVSVASGITRELGAGLGVVAADLNADGWTDLYVANDGLPNHLWIINTAPAGSGITALPRAWRSAAPVRPRAAWVSTPAISTATVTRTCS